MTIFLGLLIAAAITYQGLEFRKQYLLIKKMHKMMPKTNDLQVPPITHFPKQLAIGSKQDFIEEIKTLKLEHKEAYNGSLIRGARGEWLLFYRLDSFRKLSSLKTATYCVELSESFEPVSPAVDVSTHLGSTAQDLRIFSSPLKLGCLYNEEYPGIKGARSASIAFFDERQKSFLPFKRFLFSLQKTEKNWTPLTPQTEENKFIFAYQLSPLILMELDLEEGKVSFSCNKAPHILFPSDHWSDRFGALRGGTPAVDLGECYLTIFHSSFRNSEDNRVWYVMGAYTFSKTNPPQPLALSKEPLFFESIYDTPITTIYGKRKCIVFPMGLVCEGEKLFLSFGENDSSVRIMTLDKNRLLDSLQPIHFN